MLRLNHDSDPNFEEEEKNSDPDLTKIPGSRSTTRGNQPNREEDKKKSSVEGKAVCIMYIVHTIHIICVYNTVNIGYSFVIILR